eukprot:Rmarinus@m.17103
MTYNPLCIAWSHQNILAFPVRTAGAQKIYLLDASTLDGDQIVGSHALDLPNMSPIEHLSFSSSCVGLMLACVDAVGRLAIFAPVSGSPGNASLSRTYYTTNKWRSVTVADAHSPMLAISWIPFITADAVSSTPTCPHWICNYEADGYKTSPAHPVNQEAWRLPKTESKGLGRGTAAFVTITAEGRVRAWVCGQGSSPNQDAVTFLTQQLALPGATLRSGRLCSAAFQPWPDGEGEDGSLAQQPPEGDRDWRDGKGSVGVSRTQHRLLLTVSVVWLEIYEVSVFTYAVELLSPKELSVRLVSPQPLPLQLRTENVISVGGWEGQEGSTGLVGKSRSSQLVADGDRVLVAMRLRWAKGGNPKLFVIYRVETPEGVRILLVTWTLDRSHQSSSTHDSRAQVKSVNNAIWLETARSDITKMILANGPITSFDASYASNLVMIVLHNGTCLAYCGETLTRIHAVVQPDGPSAAFTPLPLRWKDADTMKRDLPRSLSKYCSSAAVSPLGVCMMLLFPPVTRDVDPAVDLALWRILPAFSPFKDWTVETAEDLTRKTSDSSPLLPRKSLQSSHPNLLMKNRSMVDQNSSDRGNNNADLFSDRGRCSVPPPLSAADANNKAAPATLGTFPNQDDPFRPSQSPQVTRDAPNPVSQGGPGARRMATPPNQDTPAAQRARALPNQDASTKRARLPPNQDAPFDKSHLQQSSQGSPVAPHRIRLPPNQDAPYDHTHMLPNQDSPMMSPRSRAPPNQDAPYDSRISPSPMSTSGNYSTMFHTSAPVRPHLPPHQDVLSQRLPNQDAPSPANALNPFPPNPEARYQHSKVDKRLPAAFSTLSRSPRQADIPSLFSSHASSRGPSRLPSLPRSAPHSEIPQAQLGRVSGAAATSSPSASGSPRRSQILPGCTPSPPIVPVSSIPSSLPVAGTGSTNLTPPRDSPAQTPTPLLSEAPLEVIPSPSPPPDDAGDSNAGPPRNSAPQPSDNDLFSQFLSISSPPPPVTDEAKEKAQPPEPTSAAASGTLTADSATAVPTTAPSPLPRSCVEPQKAPSTPTPILAWQEPPTSETVGSAASPSVDPRDPSSTPSTEQKPTSKAGSRSSHPLAKELSPMVPGKAAEPKQSLHAGGRPSALTQESTQMIRLDSPSRPLGLVLSTRSRSAELLANPTGLPNVMPSLSMARSRSSSILTNPAKPERLPSFGSSLSMKRSRSVGLLTNRSPNVPPPSRESLQLSLKTSPGVKLQSRPQLSRMQGAAKGTEIRPDGAPGPNHQEGNSTSMVHSHVTSSSMAPPDGTEPRPNLSGGQSNIATPKFNAPGSPSIVNPRASADAVRSHSLPVSSPTAAAVSLGLSAGASPAPLPSTGPPGTDYTQMRIAESVGTNRIPPGMAGATSMAGPYQGDARLQPGTYTAALQSMPSGNVSPQLRHGDAMGGKGASPLPGSVGLQMNRFPSGDMRSSSIIETRSVDGSAPTGLGPPGMIMQRLPSGEVVMQSPGPQPGLGPPGVSLQPSPGPQPGIGPPGVSLQRLPSGEAVLRSPVTSMQRSRSGETAHQTLQSPAALGMQRWPSGEAGQQPVLLGLPQLRPGDRRSQVVGLGAGSMGMGRMASAEVLPQSPVGQSPALHSPAMHSPALQSPGPQVGVGPPGIGLTRILSGDVGPQTLSMGRNTSAESLGRQVGMGPPGVGLSRISSGEVNSQSSMMRRSGSSESVGPQVGLGPPGISLKRVASSDPPTMYMPRRLSGSKSPFFPRSKSTDPTPPMGPPGTHLTKSISGVMNAGMRKTASGEVRTGIKRQRSIDKAPLSPLSSRSKSGDFAKRHISPRSDREYVAPLSPESFAKRRRTMSIGEMSSVSSSLSNEGVRRTASVTQAGEQERFSPVPVLLRCDPYDPVIGGYDCQWVQHASRIFARLLWASLLTGTDCWDVGQMIGMLARKRRLLVSVTIAKFEKMVVLESDSTSTRVSSLLRSVCATILRCCSLSLLGAPRYLETKDQWVLRRTPGLPPLSQPRVPPVFALVWRLLDIEASQLLQHALNCLVVGTGYQPRHSLPHELHQWPLNLVQDGQILPASVMNAACWIVDFSVLCIRCWSLWLAKDPNEDGTRALNETVCLANIVDVPRISQHDVPTLSFLVDDVSLESIIMGLGFARNLWKCIPEESRMLPAASQPCINEPVVATKQGVIRTFLRTRIISSNEAQRHGWAPMLVSQSPQTGAEFVDHLHTYFGILRSKVQEVRRGSHSVRDLVEQMHTITDNQSVRVVFSHLQNGLSDLLDEVEITKWVEALDLIPGLATWVMTGGLVRPNDDLHTDSLKRDAVTLATFRLSEQVIQCVRCRRVSADGSGYAWFDFKSVLDCPMCGGRWILRKPKKD